MRRPFRHSLQSLRLTDQCLQTLFLSAARKDSRSQGLSHTQKAQLGSKRLGETCTIHAKTHLPLPRTTHLQSKTPRARYLCCRSKPRAQTCPPRCPPRCKASLGLPPPIRCQFVHNLCTGLQQSGSQPASRSVNSCETRSTKTTLLHARAADDLPTFCTRCAVPRLLGMSCSSEAVTLDRLSLSAPQLPHLIYTQSHLRATCVRRDCVMQLGNWKSRTGAGCD